MCTNTCKDLTAVICYSEYVAKSCTSRFEKTVRLLKGTSALQALYSNLREPTLASAPLAPHVADSTLWAEAASQVDA
jgi:hypothetical protein